MNSLTLFLAWQSPARRWYTVGRLSRTSDGLFEFVYTAGLKEAQAQSSMPLLAGMTEPSRRYLSESLFPHFQNRIMARSREDFAPYVERLGLPDASDPLAILARSEGLRQTDDFRLFAGPQEARNAAGDRSLTFRFFSHGMRQIPADDVGDAADKPLYLMWDFQNPQDGRAIMIRTESNHLLGWVPRYYNDDLLRLRELGSTLNARAERVNPKTTPPWYRVLCVINVSCPEGFRPMAAAEYRPLA